MAENLYFITIIHTIDVQLAFKKHNRNSMILNYIEINSFHQLLDTDHFKKT